MPPFIVWTMRRTGGTSLAALLVECSGLPAWEDEAFNFDRELGTISGGYEATSDLAALEAQVAAALTQRRTLKHCLETVPWHVTRAVLRQSQAQGYGHVLLLRLNETERQLSLALAELTGAWGPDTAAERYRDLAEGRVTLPPADMAALKWQVNSDAACLGRMVRALLAGRTPYITVFYEDLFTGEEAARRSHFDAVARHLGLAPDAAGEAAVHRALMDQAQNTRTIYRFLPNLDKAVALIEAAT